MLDPIFQKLLGKKCSSCGCAQSLPLCLTRLRPIGLWPARFLCPWDFPGRNTEVGCHFLLQVTFRTWKIFFFLTSPASPALQVASSPTEPWGKPKKMQRWEQIKWFLKRFFASENKQLRIYTYSCLMVWLDIEYSLKDIFCRVKKVSCYHQYCYWNVWCH